MCIVGFIIAAVVFSAADVLVHRSGDRSRRATDCSFLIGQEVGIFALFEDFPYGLIAVCRLHRRAGARRHESVCSILLLQRQYAAAAAAGFRRILHHGIHFAEIIKNDVVHLGGSLEEFLQILVIRAVMAGQVVFLLP